MNIKKVFNRALIVLVGAFYAGSHHADAAIVYEQSFSGSGAISNVGWNALAVRDSTGTNIDISDYSKQAGLARKYVFFAPRLSAGPDAYNLRAAPCLFFTDAAEIQIDIRSLTQVGFDYIGDPVNAAFRVAVKVDDQWVVQATATVDTRNNPGPTGGFLSAVFAPENVVAAANWLTISNAVDGAAAMTLGPAPASDLAGTIQAIGLYLENGSDHLRFDAFRVTDTRGESLEYHSDPIVGAMQRAKKFQEGQPERRHYNWLTGTFYSGVFACYQATGEEEFLEAARNWCISADWSIRDERYLNADAICMAQTFLDVYSIDKDPKQIEKINEIFEAYYFGADTIDRNLMGRPIWKEPSRPFIGRNLWWWCDALYMAPPVLARLGQATGNPQYYDLLHRLYWDAADFLYRENEQLFMRDQHFFQKKTPTGKPVFWGRGNGWVIGGLVRTIDYLPETDSMRPKYIKLFQDMMARIVTLQGEDGMWRSSLNDPDWYPMKDSSSSSFFTFGMAAGMNRGWLDRDTYYPAAKKGWNGLLDCLSPDGKVQWSQPVAGWPGPIQQEDTRSYTQGAFLLAASEIYTLENANKAHVSCQPEPVVEVQTYCRFIQERMDDFAWENDKIAFRAYGPALRKGAENSGVDCWLKRVEYPIIDKWYGQMKQKTYHKDWGEGHDPYHVGSSAGCGGTGIWIDGRREPLETYTKQDVIECTSERSQFTLTYEREISGDVYGEEKTITIEPGTRLFDVHSIFTKNGEVASGLPICIGLTTHDGKAEPFFDEQQGWIACWETIAGSELGTAAWADPQRIDEIKEVKSDAKDKSHVFILMKTDRTGSIDYKAGYGWKKAGEIKTSNDWKRYLNSTEFQPLEI